MFPSKIPVAGGLTLLLSSSLLFAVQDNVWIGSSSSDWNDPSNWSLGRVPTAALEDNALIDLTTPLAIIGGNIPSVGDLKVGFNAPGQVNQIAGSATSNSTYVGVGSTGTLNLADPDGADITGMFTGLKRGTGSHNAGMSLHVGGWLGNPAGVGVVNINTTGTLTTEHSHIGEVGAGTLNMDGGTWTNTAFLLVGEFGGVGTVNQSAGTVNVNNGWLGIGFGDNGGNPASDASSYRMTGGQLNVGLSLEIGADHGGTFDMSGSASVNVGNGSGGFVAVGLRSGGKGVLNISGGSINLGEGAAFFVAREFGSTGVVTQTGGIIGPSGISNSFFSIGDQFESNGTYNLQGGSLSMSGAGAFIGPSGNGTLNVSGGAASFQGIAVGFMGKGTVNQTGGSITTNAWFDLGVGPGTPMSEARYVGSAGTLTTDFINVGRDHGASMDVSGTAQISTRGFAIEGGEGSQGIVVQSGGKIGVSQSIFMGFNPSSMALLEHTGGTLDTDTLFLGNGLATPRFVTTGDLNVGVTVPESGEVNIRSFLGIAGGTVEAGGNLVVRKNGTIFLSPDGNLNVRNGTPAGSITAGNINITGDTATIDGLVSRGTSASTGRTRIGNGATLNGSGVIEGPLDILSGGTLAPGLSPGLLTSGDLWLMPGAHLSLEIGGLTIGTEHDAIMVTGSVIIEGDLVGSALIGGWSGSPGDIIYAIINDGNDPVFGTFYDGTFPIVEGGTVSIDGIQFNVQYSANADDGEVANDVALVRAVPEPSALLLLLAGLGFVFKRRR